MCSFLTTPAQDLQNCLEDTSPRWSDILFANPKQMSKNCFWCGMHSLSTDIILTGKSRKWAAGGGEDTQPEPICLSIWIMVALVIIIILHADKLSGGIFCSIPTSLLKYNGLTFCHWGAVKYERDADGGKGKVNSWKLYLVLVSNLEVRPHGLYVDKKKVLLRRQSCFAKKHTGWNKTTDCCAKFCPPIPFPCYFSILTLRMLQNFCRISWEYVFESILSFWCDRSCWNVFS